MSNSQKTKQDHGAVASQTKQKAGKHINRIHPNSAPSKQSPHPKPGFEIYKVLFAVQPYKRNKEMKLWKERKGYSEILIAAHFSI